MNAAVEQGIAVRTLILRYLAERPEPWPPTVREIGRAIGGRSPSTVMEQLNKLRRAGLIEWEPGKTRTTRLCEGQR